MSSGPFLCYRELIPSTSVANAAFFRCQHFGQDGNDMNYLIVGSASFIRIYRLYRQSKNDSCDRLSLMVTKSVFGKIRDIKIVQLPDVNASIQDNIILSFDDGKFSIMKFDPLKGDLHLIRMLNAEEGAVGRGADVHVKYQSRLTSPGIGCHPFLTIDDGGALACSILYSSNLFFIPLPTPLYALTNAPVPVPFITDISSFDLPGPILDIAFISGYSMPTLAILQESLPLPVGHLCKARHTCTLTIVAVDIFLASISILWQQKELPHDSFRLISTKRVISSTPEVIIISMNAILLVSQHAVIGMAVNGFAGVTIADHIRIQPWPLAEALELDASFWDVPFPGTIVGALKDGNMLQVHLTSGLESVWIHTKLEPQLLAKSIPVSCFCVAYDRNGKVSGEDEAVKKQLWFLGSSVSDSLLLDVTAFVSFTSAAERAAAYQLSISGTPAAKKPRRFSRAAASTPLRPTTYTPLVKQKQSNSMECVTDTETEETELYGNTLKYLAEKGNSVCSISFQIVVCDSISVFGPILDCTFSTCDESLGLTESLNWERPDLLPVPWSSTVAAYIADKDAKENMLVTTGLGVDASIRRISRGFRLSKICSRDFSGVTHMCSVVIDVRNTTFIFICHNGRTRVIESSLSMGSDDQMRVSEISSVDWGFVDCGLTILTSFVSKDLLAQVFALGVRLVRISAGDGQALQDVLIEDDVELGGLCGTAGETVVSADICPGWVSLQSSVGNVYILKLMEDCDELVLRWKYSTSNRDRMDTESMEDESIGQIPLSNPIVCMSIFQEHLNIAPPIDKLSSSQSNNIASNITAEELYLYGVNYHSADESNTDNEMDVESSPPQDTLIGNNATQVSDDISRKNKISVSDTYMIACTCDGIIHLFRLADMQEVMYLTGVLSSLPLITCHIIDPSGSQSSLDDKKYNSTDDAGTLRAEPVCVRLSRVGGDPADYATNRLCLCVLTASEDVIVYSANESVNIDHQPSEKYATMHSFSRMDHGVVARRRRPFNGKRNNVDPPISAPYILAIRNIDGRAGLLVSGPTPLLLSADKGYPFLMPICMPELPTVSETGSYILSPLSCGGVNGIVTLFRDVHSVGVKTHQSPRMSTLSLYQEVLGLRTHPGACVTSKRTSVSCTVHKCVEFNSKTDDKTQLALLRRKTFALSCSETDTSPFKRSPISAKEQEEDTSNHERYYPEMNSFFYPDESFGSAPSLSDNKYKVVLVQNSVAVDSYQLPEGERVLDIEAVSLPVSDNESGDFMSSAASFVKDKSSKSKSKRRVFLIVATSICDFHGEDTQGEGRLLLFALDYALYENGLATQSSSTKNTDQDDNATAAESRRDSLDQSADNAESKIDAGESNLTSTDISEAKTADGNVSENVEDQNKLDTGTMGDATAAAAAGSAEKATLASRTKPSTAQSQSNAQALFLGAIQPKLRLISTGPGPATVVRQFGDLVLSTVGPMVYLYRLNSETMELDQIVQFYAQVITLYEILITNSFLIYKSATTHFICFLMILCFYFYLIVLYCQS